VRAADQWAAAGDFRRRLLEAFRTNGIELSGAPLEIPARDAVGELGASAPGGDASTEPPN